MWSLCFSVELWVMNIKMETILTLIRPENERNVMNLDSRKQNITRKETCDVANLVDKECELK